MNMELEPVQKPEFYPFIESIPNVIECNCVTGNYSMLMKVAFPSAIELDGFIGQLQHFGKTQTQIRIQQFLQRKVYGSRHGILRSVPGRKTGGSCRASG